MNFLFHYALAARDTGSKVAGTGAMLPDVWRMAARRARAKRGVDRSEAEAPLAELLAGVDHHLDADLWFHGALVFAEGERQVMDAIRDAEMDATKVGLFAHIGWELALDGALLRSRGAASMIDELRDAFTTSAPFISRVAHAHFASKADFDHEAFDAGVNKILAAIAEGEWIASYQHGDGIARAIDAIRLRFGLGRFTARDRERLAGVFDSVAQEADAGARTILAATRG